MQYEETPQGFSIKARKRGSFVETTATIATRPAKKSVVRLNLGCNIKDIRPKMKLDLRKKPQKNLIRTIMTAIQVL